MVSTVGVSCGILSLQKAGLCNRQDANAHGGNIAAVFMNLSGDLMDPFIVGFIKSMAVETARQDQGTVITGVDLRKEEIWPDYYSKSTSDEFMKTCCGDGYLGKMLPIVGPTENIQDRYRLEVFKALLQKKAKFEPIYQTPLIFPSSPLVQSDVRWFNEHGVPRLSGISSWCSSSEISPSLLGESSLALLLSLMFEVIGFVARNNTPLVMGELLKPVSVTNSASAKPVCFSKARKSFPGMAPPSHLNQLSIIVLLSF